MWVRRAFPTVLNEEPITRVCRFGVGPVSKAGEFNIIRKGNSVHKVFISIIATPLIYLAIAFSLVFLPFGRSLPEEGLDFDALNLEELSVSSSKESHYVTRDQTELFYRYIEGTSDISIVLLHGSGSEGRYLIPLASRLNEKYGVTVIIPDLRGHGRSQGTMPGDVSYLGQLEHDLEDLLIQLKSSHPNTRVVLGGHSSGGGLAVKYGGNNLKQFDGAILLAPYLGYQAPTVRPNSGGWIQVAKLRYAGLAMLNNIGIKFLNIYPVLFFNRPAEVTDKLQLDSYSYRLNESFSPQTYATDLSRFKKPLLLMVGELDEAFYPQAFQNVLENNAPHAEFHIIKNTQHLSLPSHEKTAIIISQWLKKSYNNSSKRDAVIGGPS